MERSPPPWRCGEFSVASLQAFLLTAQQTYQSTPKIFSKTRYKPSDLHKASHQQEVLQIAKGPACQEMQRTVVTSQCTCARALVHTHTQKHVLLLPQALPTDSAMSAQTAYESDVSAAVCLSPSAMAKSTACHWSAHHQTMYDSEVFVFNTFQRLVGRNFPLKL